MKDFKGASRMFLIAASLGICGLPFAIIIERHTLLGN
jgi:hypothetical protein